MPSQQEEILPREFGKYHLIERIATGGMAELYRAKLYGAGRFEKDLAIKKVLPHLAQDDAFVQMFMDEAMITVTLSHGNIVSVIDFGEMDGEYYLVMEFVDGIDLQSLIKKGAETGDPFPPSVAAYVSEEICRGLEYAHSKIGPDGEPLQIVHRDISPQNILISFEGQVKIVDFGIARAASRITATQAGVVKGKVSYMSPEQLTGQMVDRRSDIFACGVCLYEMLTCQRPFEGDTPQATLALITRCIYTAPQKINRQIGRKLGAVLKKALEKSPKKRYQSAGKMASGLSKYLHSIGDHPSARDLASFVKERMPEARPRTLQPTPSRPVYIGESSKVQPLPRGTPPSGERIEDAQSTRPRAEQRAERFPKASGEKSARPQARAEPSSGSGIVVMDGEAVSFGMLDLPEYVIEDRIPTRPEQPKAAPIDLSRPRDEEPTLVDPPDGPPADLLHAATRILTSQPEPVLPSARGVDLDAATRILETETPAEAPRDEMLSAPTRLLSKEEATGERAAYGSEAPAAPKPAPKPAEHAAQDLSDRFAAWAMEGEQAVGKADFEDEAPPARRRPVSGAKILALVGSLAGLCAAVIILVLRPFDSAAGARTDKEPVQFGQDAEMPGPNPVRGGLASIGLDPAPSTRPADGGTAQDGGSAEAPPADRSASSSPADRKPDDRAIA
ncbi:MAG: protein kinase, partial [Deltaproteobacteria bacterium]|nr:protein kinase [Deltaproteobacteria bacterium]